MRSFSFLAWCWWPSPDEVVAQTDKQTDTRPLKWTVYCFVGQLECRLRPKLASTSTRLHFDLHLAPCTTIVTYTYFSIFLLVTFCRRFHIDQFVDVHYFVPLTQFSKGAFFLKSPLFFLSYLLLSQWSNCCKLAGIEASWGSHLAGGSWCR